MTDPSRVPFPPASQRACYAEWLKIEVALRYALTYPWAPEAWQEVRRHIPWLLAERSRLRRAGGSTRWPKRRSAAAHVFHPSTFTQ
jgi:hypothetical protein